MVKTVSSGVSTTYIFGIGGISKKADLQGLINVTVKNSTKVILFVTKTTYCAEGTVIEFDK